MRPAFWSILGVSVAAIGGLLFLMREGGRAVTPSAPAKKAVADATGPLLVYCAAGLQKPVDEAVAEYRREFNANVELQFGGSNTLLTSIELSRKGDLFVAADEIYLQQGREKKLVGEILQLATQKAVIAVKAGNPLKVVDLKSLADPNVRVGLASEAAAIGKTSQEILEAASLWTQVKDKVVAFKPTVSDVANDLKLGVIDAAILWDATVVQFPEFEGIAIDSPANKPQSIAVGVLTSAKNPSQAMHLACYLAARDRGLKVFEKYKYPVVEGAAWSGAEPAANAP